MDKKRTTQILTFVSMIKIAYICIKQGKTSINGYGQLAIMAIKQLNKNTH